MAWTIQCFPFQNDTFSSYVLMIFFFDLNGPCVFSLQIHVCSLETGKPVVCVGGSPGDFTCVNLKDAPPHLLVCGNKDRR